MGLLFCHQCKLSFQPKQGTPRYCGFECNDKASLAKLNARRRAKAEALYLLPETVQEASKLVTSASIEAKFPGVFLLEWAI